MTKRTDVPPVAEALSALPDDVLTELVRVRVQSEALASLLKPVSESLAALAEIAAGIRRQRYLLQRRVKKMGKYTIEVEDAFWEASGWNLIMAATENLQDNAEDIASGVWRRIPEEEEDFALRRAAGDDASDGAEA